MGLQSVLTIEVSIFRSVLNREVPMWTMIHNSYLKDLVILCGRPTSTSLEQNGISANSIYRKRDEMIGPIIILMEA